MELAARSMLSVVPLSASLVFPALAQSPDWKHREPLPAPTGSHQVGTAVAHFTDSSRGTSRHITVRPLTVQLWYPAQSATGRGASYLHEPGLLDSMIQRGYLDLHADDMRGWADVRLRAHLDAVPADPPEPTGWPVVVLSHGLGVARAHYSALSEELASHGYVVLAIDHPIGGFTLIRMAES